jgi:hypothetical protein
LVVGFHPKAAEAEPRNRQTPDHRDSATFVLPVSIVRRFLFNTSPSWGMLSSVGMWRSYEIVSSSGTQGTYFQRLLLFTTARKKAPDGLIEALFRRYLVDPRVRKNRDRAIPPRWARRASSS